MIVGACCGPDMTVLLDNLGYEQIEFSASYIASLDDAALEELKKLLEDKKIRLRSTNCLFPGEITPLYQDEDLSAARAYLEKLMPRLKMLGVQTSVFGSGRYRRMPEEMPAAQRHEKMCGLLRLMEKIARENGVTIVIEPLNQDETNMLNTTKESMEYIQVLNLPNLRLLVDLYHFYREGEPIERIREYGAYLRDVHIAEPTRRDFLRPDDSYDYRPFFCALRESGYHGAVMFEGGKGDFTTGIAQTYPVLRALCKGE